MNRMDIPNRHRAQTRFVFLFLLLSPGFVYVIKGCFDIALASSGASSLLHWGIALALATIPVLSFVMLFEERSSYLVASKPPQLVTTRTWFRRIKSKKTVEINDAVWVRARHETNEADLIVVEIGTSGYRTTMLDFFPYSESNIPLATLSCAEIAAFLGLEDRGYRNLA